MNKGFRLSVVVRSCRPCCFSTSSSTSVAALLERQAATTPDAVCMVATSTSQRWTYSEIHQKAAALSAGLSFAG
jgi:acyl-CoA synthetase (AMP-forming)/AMP-acid ligase II